MRILLLPNGVVRGKRARRGPRRYLPGGWADETAPLQAYAVEHPEGICLFDAGQTVAHAPLPGLHPYLRLARFELTEADELARQVDPGRVRWLVLSHLHTDHVGAVGAFHDAEVVVSRREWEDARGWRGRLRGYVPHHWPAGVEPRLVSPGPPAVGPFPGSVDLAGDGRLLVVPTPGHTAGHLALLVDLDGVRVLLAGDAAPTAAELAERLPDVAAWCRAEGVTVLTAHDPDSARLVAAATEAPTSR